MTEFRMKVEDLFVVAGKTILVGDMPSHIPFVSAAQCTVMVAGVEKGQITIEGEVFGARGHRDLWTRSALPLDRASVADQDVWLVCRLLSQQADE